MNKVLLAERLRQAGGDPRRVELFVVKVDFDAPNGCWIWTAGKSAKTGYGVFGIVKDGRPTTTSAHRWIYELLVGPAEGLDVDHLCRVPPCVNVLHLEAVTHKENLQRGVFVPNIQSHCKNGHEWTESNTATYIQPRNGRPYRQCIQCGRDRAKARYLRIKLSD